MDFLFYTFYLTYDGIIYMIILFVHFAYANFNFVMHLPLLFYLLLATSIRIFVRNLAIPRFLLTTYFLYCHRYYVKLFCYSNVYTYSFFVICYSIYESCSAAAMSVVFNTMQKRCNVALFLEVFSPKFIRIL